MKKISPVTAPQPLSAGLRAFTWIAPLLWLLSLSYAVLTASLLHRPDTFRWIFYSPPAFDYYNYTGRMYYLHRPEFFTHPGYSWYYPAPDVFMLNLFYSLGRLSGNWLTGYLAYLGVALAGSFYGALRLGRGLVDRGVPSLPSYTLALVAVVFSWPIYFSLQRGNVEAVTWLIFALAIWAFGRSRWMLMAVLLGVVASFKLYPALCFALLLRPRRWKELTVGLVTTAAITLVALRFLEPSIPLAWNGVRTGIAKWTNDYASSYSPHSATYDHSLYAIVKVLTHTLHPDYSTYMQKFLVVAGVLALLVFFTRVIRLPRTNQLLFTVTAAVFLPPASFDYTLQNMYIPFAWTALALASAPSSVRSPRTSTTLFVLFALLMGPETFIMWNDMTAAGLLKGVILLGILVYSVVVPLPDLALVSLQTAPSLPSRRP